MINSDPSSIFYTLTDRSFDELLFYFHKHGFDPAPGFKYSLVKGYMLSRRWSSFYDASCFLKRYLSEVKS